MAITITIRNNFHNTEVNVRVPHLPYTLSPSQTYRMENALCGFTGCGCGAVRGPYASRATLQDGSPVMVKNVWDGDRGDVWVARDITAEDLQNDSYLRGQH